MNIPTRVAAVVDALSDHSIGEGVPTPDDAVASLRTILLARNLIEHHAIMLIADLDRLSVARRQGRTNRELLIALGCAPATAQRFIRLAEGSATLPAINAELADGALSAEHADAIVRGMSHIEHRCPEPNDARLRLTHMTTLLAQRRSGATPAEIMQSARQIANEQAAASGDVSPADDRSINELTCDQTPDGRLRLRADLDIVAGEKLVAALDRLGEPRPEPDGARDRRSPSRRRADALETLLDLAANPGNHVVTAPRVQVALTIPADRPEHSTLQFLGPASLAAVTSLTCDAELMLMIVDEESVPMDVGRSKRLFTAAQRKALHQRDQCCIKCGAPPSWTHAHHIVHWSHGGPTSLDNGCLLCPSCHDAVHNAGWDVVLGVDRHPWLIPPRTIDPRRRPRPAYNRRTLTVENLPAVA